MLADRRVAKLSEWTDRQMLDDNAHLAEECRSACRRAWSAVRPCDSRVPFVSLRSLG
jgi:hypothetical protein